MEGGEEGEKGGKEGRGGGGGGWDPEPPSRGVEEGGNCTLAPRWAGDRAVGEEL